MPSIEQFIPQMTAKPWGVEILVAKVEGLYTGKILRRYDFDVFHRAGLQFHPSRDETFHLFSGHAIVYFDPGDGQLRKVHMLPGESFHVPPGAVHSVQTVGESIMFETSVPVDEIAVRVEENYRIEDAIDVTAEMMQRIEEQP